MTHVSDDEVSGAKGNAGLLSDTDRGVGGISVIDAGIDELLVFDVWVGELSTATVGVGGFTVANDSTSVFSGSNVGIGVGKGGFMNPYETNAASKPPIPTIAVMIAAQPVRIPGSVIQKDGFLSMGKFLLKVV